jgi:hypothetical protein
MYKYYNHKTYKKKFNKSYKKKNKTIKSPKKEIDEYTEITDAIMDFNFSTDWDQVFKSEEDKKIHLNKNLEVLKKAFNKYIQKRTENINNAMIKS